MLPKAKQNPESVVKEIKRNARRKLNPLSLNLEKDHPFYPYCSGKINKIRIMSLVAATCKEARSSLFKFMINIGNMQ